MPSSSLLIRFVLGAAVLTPAVPPAPRALPTPQTLYARLLNADLVCIARCRLQAAQPAHSFMGRTHDVEVVEVLMERAGKPLPKQGLQLDDSIPGSSMIGQRHPVPAGVDVLLFGQRGLKGDKQIGLLPFCLNSVVPLQGQLQEYPGPRYEVRKMAAADFLAAARKLVVKFGTFEFLQREFEQALGSRHPFASRDKPVLLQLLLALPDPRVPAFAEGLRDADLPSSSRAVLDRYFVRCRKLEPLREKFGDLLGAYRGGGLGGTELFRFPDGSMNPRRPRRERLLDAAMTLHEAGDLAWVAARMLPLLRSGDTFVSRFLIRAGVEEALVRTIKAAAGAPGGSAEAASEMRRAALQTLVHSDEHTGVLAAVRLALAGSTADRAALVQELQRVVGRRGVPAPDASSDRRQWQAWWRAHRGSWPRAFPAGTLDQQLGTEEGW